MAVLCRLLRISSLVRLEALPRSLLVSFSQLTCYLALLVCCVGFCEQAVEVTNSFCPDNTGALTELVTSYHIFAN
jgi:hypothetical protein